MGSPPFLHVFPPGVSELWESPGNSTGFPEWQVLVHIPGSWKERAVPGGAEAFALEDDSVE